MATINVYSTEPGRQMIWSLESAKRFLESTKKPLCIRTANGYYEIHNGSIALNERVDEWVEIQRWRKTGDEAIRCLYQLRKVINAYFWD